MKVGLVDVDSHNFPNLALMKISAFHKAGGDQVEFANPLEEYGYVYKSKVFTFSEDDPYKYKVKYATFHGGTGYRDKLKIKLPVNIESVCPDYSLYNCQHAYGYLTRGCPNKCSWCIVPEKEGNIREAADIDEFLGDMDSAVLLDNNVLASEFGIKQIEKIIERKIKVDFNQGLDARIIAGDPAIAKLLSKVKWLEPVRMACDNINQIKFIRKAVELLRWFNCRPIRYFVYVLVQEIEEALEIVRILISRGF